jgi:hypothetical protein
LDLAAEALLSIGKEASPLCFGVVAMAIAKSKAGKHCSARASSAAS